MSDTPDSNVEYTPITTEQAVDAVRKGDELRHFEIPDFGKLLEGIKDEKDQSGNPVTLRCVGCRILKCDCNGMQIDNPIDCSPPESKWFNPVYQTVFTQNANFRGATFTQDADFSGVTFEQDVSFSVATFTQDASFSEVTFEQSAHFHGATFTQHADFTWAMFTQHADFRDTTFTQDASFWLTKFTWGANFRGAMFTQHADFRDATFTQDADFMEARFTQDANFSLATFTQDANFRRATFTQVADFSRATLSQVVDFRNATFGQRASLNLGEVNIRPDTVIYLSIDQIGRRTIALWIKKCLFRLMTIQAVRRCAGSFIHRLIRLHIRLSVCLIAGEDSDDTGELKSAADQYNMLRDNFRKLPSTDDEEDRCHYKYKDLMRRAVSAKFPKLKWWKKGLDWAVMKWCLGYGIYTKRILFTAGAVILFFAGVYGLWSGTGFVHNGSADPAGGAQFNALYFSIITFTTIGYGDWAPVGPMRYVCGVEGLLGLILMSVFTVSFARKLLR